MKALYIAILATFIFALLIIYHDSRRSQNARPGHIQILVCNGKIVRIAE
ncbi:MAG: hypothetical protein PHV82_14700 [Victivallaceae bacterium]|nr:hypothetical protein [Victivallaceae bacterium]